MRIGLVQFFVGTPFWGSIPSPPPWVVTEQRITKGNETHDWDDLVNQADRMCEVRLGPPEEQAPQVFSRRRSILSYLGDEAIPGQQAIVDAVVHSVCELSASYSLMTLFKNSKLKQTKHKTGVLGKETYMQSTT